MAVAGDLAPDLAFLDPAGQALALSDWRGQPVLLVFLRWLG